MKSKIKNNGDFDGNYTDEWLIANQNKTIKGDLVANWITTSNVYDGSNGFIHPNLSGGVWIDSASPETIGIEKKKYYSNEIEKYFKYLYVRALASSMNKSNLDIGFLTAQREVYQDKYDVAKGIITSGVKYDNTLELIQGEMVDEFSEDVLDVVLPTFGITPTGTHLNKMFQLIIFKFEYGLNAFSNFKKFIERFRTKCFTWLDVQLYSKIESAFSIVDDMPESLTLVEAQQLYDNFNAI